MDQSHASIALILDRSGSMHVSLEPAIAAANDFLRDQANAEGSAELTLCLFDHRLEYPFVATDILDVPELTPATYVPRGSTALLDAIGSTVTELGDRLAAMPPTNRPGSVIVAIVTDGLENASTRFDWQQIATMIRHQEDVYSWNFLFLAADEDAIAQAGQIGIRNANTASFTADSVGYASSADSMNLKVRAMRASRFRGLSGTETRVSESNLQELVDERDRRGRKS